jgi:hypothetical protein
MSTFWAHQEINAYMCTVFGAINQLMIREGIRVLTKCQLMPLEGLLNGSVFSGYHFMDCHYYTEIKEQMTWLNLPDCDAQSGLKGMSYKGCEFFLQTKINRFLFDTEFVLKANHCKDICLQILPIQTRQGINIIWV